MFTMESKHLMLLDLRLIFVEGELSVLSSTYGVFSEGIFDIETLQDLLVNQVVDMISIRQI